MPCLQHRQQHYCQALIGNNNPPARFRLFHPISYNSSNKVHREIEISDRDFQFPGREFMFPDKEISFPDKEISFPDKELLFPDEEMSFPDEELLFPDRVSCFRHHLMSFSCKKMQNHQKPCGIISIPYSYSSLPPVTITMQ